MFESGPTAACQHSGQRPRKGVSGACRVAQLAHGIGGDGEKSVGVEEHRPVFPRLHYRRFRPHAQKPVARAYDIALAGELFCFGVVYDEYVRPLDELPEGGVRNLYPQVHRVQNHERIGFHGVEGTLLDIGADVAQQQELRAPRSLAELGNVVFIDVHARFEGLAAAEIVVVLSAPKKRFPAAVHFHVGHVRPAPRESRHVGFFEIPPDYSADGGGGEKRRGERRV